MAGYLDVTLDKPRRLRFTMLTVRDLELDVRKSLGVTLRDALGGDHMLVLGPKLLQHGLRGGGDQSITEERAIGLLQNMIDSGGDVTDVYTTALEALNLSGALGRDIAERTRALREARAVADDGPLSEPPSSSA